MAVSNERILIIDDEEIIRLILNRKLSREGYRCEESDNAKKALAKLESKPTKESTLRAAF